MSKVTRVTSLWYVEENDEASSATGLYLRLADGRVLRHQSMDAIMPFEEPKTDSEVQKTIKAQYENLS